MKITKEFIAEGTVKALVSLIPFAGGPIGSLLADTLAERKEQRLNDFLTQLKEDLDAQREKINSELITKDDFPDIFELTTKKVLDERNTVKRTAYRNIIVNGITREDSDFDDMEQCIRLIENTTEQNIYLLKILSDPEEHNNSIGNPVKKPTGNLSTTTISRTLQALLPNWTGGQILENLKDLEFIGLIQPISNSFQDMISGYGLSPIVKSLTLKGERFISYIKG